MKKGQITPFIILGILIIIATSTFIYINQLDNKGLDVEINQKYVMDGSIEPVRMYIESCLKQISEEPIKNIGKSGGYLEPNDYKYYDENKISYLCIDKDNYGCTNTVLLKEEMEEQIAEIVKKDIDSCINLKIFEEQGYKIEEEPIDIEVRIGLDEVEVKAHYPLLFKKNSSTLKIENFKAEHSLPLGILYFQATNIVNIENTEDKFNAVDFATKNGKRITIEKHKPYPDTIYMLKSEGLEFNFALQGKDTISEISLRESENEESLGCCYIKYDNNCYKNVEQSTCEAKGGIYDPNNACVCPIIDNMNDESCNGEECKTCNVLVGNLNITKEHGESWCSYDSIAGNGNDYVGSRHILHSCIDGKEVIEECRDFREEICTQKTTNNNGNVRTDAVCRINRWNDCYFCDTEACCKDSTYRDCSWELIETGEQKCIPEVPPGFRFWEGNGKEICSLADSKKECNGFSCNDDWVTGNAKLCRSYGDCGNYRNINNNITKEGFFHTSIKGKISDSVYLDDNVFNYHYPELSLDFENTKQNPILKSYAAESSEKLNLIISSYYSFLDQISRIRTSDYYTNNKQDDIKTLNVAICNLWDSPDGGLSCNMCNSGESPCSEYKCMSLGKECIYSEEKGIGKCEKADNSITEKPKIHIPKESIKPKYTFEETTLSINDMEIEGIKINEKLKPYQMIEFRIDSSSETICKMSYLPDTKIISGIRISEKGFSNNHSISLRVPPQPKIPSNLLDLLNSSNSKGIIGNLLSIKDSINTIENSGLKNILTSIFGNELFKENEEKLSGFVKLFTTDIPRIRESLDIVMSKTEENSYYMFFSCQDKKGQESTKPFFFEVSIESFEDDEKAPILIGSIPENDTLFAYDDESIQTELYFDEPAECRYAKEDIEYSEMKNILKCVDSIYDYSNRFGGSYQCKDEINLTDDMLNIFIRCRDNPQKIEEKEFAISYSNISKNISYLRMSGLGEIENEIIETSSKEILIEHHMDEMNECILSYSPGVRVPGNCSLSDNRSLGLYSCKFNMTILDEVPEIENTSNTSYDSSNISVSLLCNKKANYTQNENTKSAIYHLERSEPIEALDFGPKDEIHTTRPLLYLETSPSKNVECGYYKELALGISRMNNIEQFKFSKVLDDAEEGDNTYYVYCSDEYGNELLQKIRFFIVP